MQQSLGHKFDRPLQSKPASVRFEIKLEFMRNFWRACRRKKQAIDEHPTMLHTLQHRDEWLFQLQIEPLECRNGRELRSSRRKNYWNHGNDARARAAEAQATGTNRTKLEPSGYHVEAGDATIEACRC